MTANPTDNIKLYRAGFGGGCHWCTEAVFQSLRGVINTQQGWIASLEPHDTLSEAVLVEYDPSIISLDDLVTIHLFTHSSASKHSMRKKYRSAVYFFSDEQRQVIQQAIRDNQAHFESPVITLPLPFRHFKASPEQYQNYYKKNHNRPFCNTYISPKLKTLMTRFSEHYKEPIKQQESTTPTDQASQPH